MPDKNCLIIFTRKPERGKVKTRLAKGIGDEKALAIYKYLLRHSAKITSQVKAQRQVWYTNSIEKKDNWDDDIFEKHVQIEGDLGQKMGFAFKHNFKLGFKKVVIIGTDLLDIDAKSIENAFHQLENHDVVIGPAEDGGYYLLGMNLFIPEIFQNIEWSTKHVMKQTLKRLPGKSVALLDQKNDIDFQEDALRHPQLRKIIHL